MEEIMTKINDDHHQNEKKLDDDDHQGKNMNGGKKTTLRTPADIYEYPSFYSFILDMPGLDAQNIKVKVENGILHVSGKKKKKQIIGEPINNEGVKVIRIERRRARYMRKFILAEDASSQDVKATYKDGVLSITVVKNKLSTTIQPIHEHSKPNSLTNVSIS
ncbi:unnamed protein product [Amaranthus hypochondriacus]